MRHSLLTLILLAAAGGASAQTMQTQGAGDMNTNTQMESGNPVTGGRQKSSGTAATASTSASVTPETANAPRMTGAAGIAQKRIEMDGYKNVTGLAQGADGLWHGNAMRGSTSIQVTVDRAGKVVAQ